MSKPTVRPMRSDAQSATAIPLRDITVVWAPGAPGEKRFTGLDVARLLHFAMGRGDAEKATNTGIQSSMVSSLSTLLGTLNTAEALDGNELWLLSEAAADIAARMECSANDAEAEKRCDDFVVIPKAVAS
jgi:hypothetical protein